MPNIALSSSSHGKLLMKPNFNNGVPALGTGRRQLGEYTRKYAFQNGWQGTERPRRDAQQENAKRCRKPCATNLTGGNDDDASSQPVSVYLASRYHGQSTV